MQQHWQHFFAQALNLVSHDRSTWPPQLSYTMLRQWFDIEVCDMVLDLGGYTDRPTDEEGA